MNTMIDDIFSIREGNHPSGGSVSLTFLRAFVVRKFDELRMKGYFCEKYGFAINASYRTTTQLEIAMSNLRFDFLTDFMALARKSKFDVLNLETVETKDDVFDIFEYFYAISSKPVINSNPLIVQVKEYDKGAAESEILDFSNRLLPHFEGGWELAENGKIRRKPPSGLEPLIADPLPCIADTDIKAIVSNAIVRFHSRNSSETDRRSAIVDLAAVIEKIRPETKKYLIKKDEGALFNILNNFGIRHLNDKQMTEYRAQIFYPWIFYYLLASISAIMQLKNSESDQ